MVGIPAEFIIIFSEIIFFVISRNFTTMFILLSKSPVIRHRGLKPEISGASNAVRESDFFIPLM